MLNRRWTCFLKQTQGTGKSAKCRWVWVVVCLEDQGNFETEPSWLDLILLLWHWCVSLCHTSWVSSTLNSMPGIIASITAQTKDTSTLSCTNKGWHAYHSHFPPLTAALLHLSSAHLLYTIKTLYTKCTQSRESKAATKLQHHILFWTDICLECVLIRRQHEPGPHWYYTYVYAPYHMAMACGTTQRIWHRHHQLSQWSKQSPNTPYHDWLPHNPKKHIGTGIHQQTHKNTHNLLQKTIKPTCCNPAIQPITKLLKDHTDPYSWLTP